jgi:type VI protein secretion system component VasF
VTVLDVAEHQRRVRESADAHISRQLSTMESKKRTPMLRTNRKTLLLAQVVLALLIWFIFYMLIYTL